MHQVSQSISDFDKNVNDFGLNVYAASNDVAVSMTNSGASINSDPKVGFNRATEEILHDWSWTKGAHTLVGAPSSPGVSTTKTRYSTAPELGSLTGT